MEDRLNPLAAQKVQVALVFQKMVSTEEARAYLLENNFTEASIDRILGKNGSAKRSVPVEIDEP